MDLSLRRILFQRLCQIKIRLRPVYILILVDLVFFAEITVFIFLANLFVYRALLP